MKKSFAGFRSEIPLYDERSETHAYGSNMNKPKSNAGVTIREGCSRTAAQYNKII